MVRGAVTSTFMMGSSGKVRLHEAFWSPMGGDLKAMSGVHVVAEPS